MGPPTPPPTILFDGFCNFCVGAVKFIIQRDRSKRFRFAPVQSPVGQRLLQEHRLRQEQLRSFVLVENGRVYEKSGAALRVARRLRGFWPLLSMLRIIPRPLRDLCYTLFAKRRYALFGKRETCILPSGDIADRFLL